MFHVELIQSHVTEINLYPIIYSDNVGATLRSNNWDKMAVAMHSVTSEIETQLIKLYTLSLSSPYCPSQSCQDP